MFKKLLIANRGEIAVRVMRTARRLGIATVAVYSDADADAAHVAFADEAVRIGPPSAKESYLDIDAVIAAARQTGAEAMHPGYGFLSENADFAEACATANIVFIGPSAQAIRAMGLKDRAKRLMASAGVAVVPGYEGEDQSPKMLATEAKRLGFPVLIKATAGGGGKGMRRVDSATEFPPALEGARREAAAAFGNGRVLIEKYVARPRHIEMQIFADSRGNAVHLFERDCSLQRRHQKVIEEATAPGMPEGMREQMGEAAVRAAKAIGYVGAGTVEFIADSSAGLKPDRFWFMEMNTRLQVEHPVTEMITGLDLVEWQLRVAAGEPLPKSQTEICAKGHAIEARLYAEDPGKGFLPSVGKLEHLKLPREDSGVRVDTGVRQGDRVTVYYDPMIAKVIAHDQTREAAAAKLANALCETEIAGVRTNTGLLVRALRHPNFVSGEIDTGFIDRNIDALLPPASTAPVYARAAERVIAARFSPTRANDPWNAQDGFRLAGEAREMLDFMSDGGSAAVLVVHHRHGGLTMSIDGTAAIPSPHSTAVNLAGGEIAVMDQGETWLLRLRNPLEQAEAGASPADRVMAPMPGKIVRVTAEAGTTVKRGQPLVVLEAMKMEHTLTASGDGKVESVDVAVGDQVREGAVLIRFAAAEGRTN
ncbi:MAG TPA: acetyl-CoA carboxylase biotin carboxylase subunit [Rhizomicrobium sp.]|jgi:acetyl-CoA carboxylase biotin carboxylase subunit|nr:acetyl-CoA carboxylase biotin carboxylase subunit [Rhizomicrobium sp.]